jgi:hypothetical protein
MPFVIFMPYADLVERCIQRFPADSPGIATPLFGKKNSGKQRKQRTAQLLFRRSMEQKPRISANNESSLAVNFMEEQRSEKSQL